VKKRDYKGATEAARKRWEKNSADTEKHIAGLHKKIEQLDKKESVAALIKKKFGKIRFDSEMETVYGSIKDAHENGFPRGVLSKTEGRSIDQIAEGDELKDFMRDKPDDRNPVDWLIEKIADGSRQDVETSGERAKLAEELYFLERTRDNALADNKLAQIIRERRKAHREQVRSGRGGADGRGPGKVAGQSQDDPDASYADEELSEVESDLDDFFADVKDSPKKPDIKPNTYRAPDPRQSVVDWWSMLTYAERAVVIGSANHRKWAAGLRGDAAKHFYGQNAVTDQFVFNAWKFNRNRHI
jgi:hypothetical protein